MRDDGRRAPLERFDTKPGPKPFRLYVVELPKRCAVYSLEHMKARKASRRRRPEGHQAERPRSSGEQRQGLRSPRVHSPERRQEPPGASWPGRLPAGMAKIPNRDVCVDRWEAHVVGCSGTAPSAHMEPVLQSGRREHQGEERARRDPAGLHLRPAVAGRVQGSAEASLPGRRVGRGLQGQTGDAVPYGNDEAWNLQRFARAASSDAVPRVTRPPSSRSSSTRASASSRTPPRRFEEGARHRKGLSTWSVIFTRVDR